VSSILTKETSGSKRRISRRDFLRFLVAAGTVFVVARIADPGKFVAGASSDIPTNDFDLEMMKIPPFCSIVVYKSGLIYKAKNMVTGVNLGTTSTTDASDVINAAIAATSKLPAAPRIGILANRYTCLTEITMTGSAAGKHGVQLIGEGRSATSGGSKLDFAPASVLQNGIYFQMFDATLCDLYIKGNSNVTNLLRIDGDGQRGHIDRCNFEGTSPTPLAGQIGVLNDAVTASATYYWRVLNCQFNQLDIGIKHHDNPNSTNAWFHSNLNFINTNVGIDSFSTLHKFESIFMQGSDLMGDVLIRLNGSGCAGCVLRNISADLMNKPGCGVVVLTPGALLNDVDGVYNSGSQAEILDNSGQKNRLRRAKYANLESQTAGLSPYTYLNRTGSLEQITVSGGAVNDIAIIRAPDIGGMSTGLTDGTFLLEANDGLKITYSNAPTIRRVGH
jgi:hypothetical protein